MPQIADLNELEKLYKTAKSGMSELDIGAPCSNCPESVEIFFRYILSSVWCNREYDPREAYEIQNRLNEASLLDVQSFLTFAGRNEHFCEGAWVRIIKNDELQGCIERAKEIIK